MTNSKKAAKSNTTTTPAKSLPAVQNTALVIGGKFRMTKRLTLPTLVLKEMDPRYLRIDDLVRQSTYVDPDPAKSEKPADICTVTDMETGAVYLLLVPTLLKSTLERDYMENEEEIYMVKSGKGETERRRMTPIKGTETYVGKIFAVQKLPKRPGKRYHDFDIGEVESDDE